MVKLISVDMDGTFLNDDKEMSPEFDKVFKALKKKNVKFCAASGRQLASLKTVFDKYKDQMLFVAENGAVMEIDGQSIVNATLTREISDKFLARLKELDDMRILYCTSDYSYIDRTDDESMENARIYLPKFEIVKDVAHIEELPVKISVHSKNGYYNDFKLLVEEFSDEASICTSGFDWLDIVPKGTNKGTAIAKMQAMLGISSKETMAFGDQMNDFEMINQAYHSYAMDNAIDKIKQIARYTAPSNNEFGVVSTLKEVFAID
ncbi:MAG: HAD family phosphatase [Peptostreptococcus stomatis]|uniref:Cof-type HAD-IIB family hydrolase n=1 Tax=Peptostreptococcus stomatis TaxID=341694 RepID=UPI001A430233|nr:HAD family hydrolase [Peptostreptococcus stomatis]MBL6465612.1 HAD family phosphatase [Peptostreptococcus stomatis]